MGALIVCFILAIVFAVLGFVVYEETDNGGLAIIVGLFSVMTMFIGLCAGGII